MGPIVVIGAGGFLGGFLAARWEQAGRTVIRVGRDDSLPAEADMVVDCNGDGRRFWANQNPAASFAANVAPVMARTASIRHRLYVLASTVDIYGRGRESQATSAETATIDPAGLDVYGFHKYLAEQLVAHHAESFLILRLGTLIGPGLRKNPVFDALNGQPIRQTLDSTLHLLHLDVLGDRLDAILAAGGQGIFNISAAAPITVGRLLEMVAARQGRTIQDFTMHPELITTRYDVNIDKVAALGMVPTAEAMLAAYLDGAP